MPRQPRTTAERTAVVPTDLASGADLASGTATASGTDTAPATDPAPDTDDWGIDLRWVDADDEPHTVNTDIIERLRAVIGTPPDDLDRTAPLVLRPGDSLAGLPGLPEAGAELAVVCEDGSRRRIAGSVPTDFPLGYHRVTTADGADGVERSMIVSPGRCWLPDGWRAWGWTVQLYAVRSESSWGFGDLGDLGSIREWAQDAGAGFLLISPLHAVAPTFPQEPSPYLPASRRFRNPLYLRVEDVPGAEDVDLADLRTAGLALTGEPVIDRDEVWRLKRAALQRIFDATVAAGTAMRDDEPDTDTDPGATDFASYRAATGKPLEEFATWCALADEYGLDFRDWPADLHRPDGAAVVRFRSENEPAIGFHAWLQWLLDRQLRASTRGMTVVQDLPIGVAGGGADAWAWQDQLADGIRIGAPPDLFNSRGQNWGSPPLIPWRMRASDYAAFIASIRATMAGTGGLRIDHVMGLFRLWWVPADGSPADGAYVRYPSADLLNIVALESHRAQAIVVGEDLGTVEPGVRERLAEHGVLSYKLLLFEDGRPEQWPVQSMAAVTTHDLPTVAGLWSGADLAEQLSYGSGAEESLIAGAAKLSSRLPLAEIDDSSTGAAVAPGRSRSAGRLRSAGGTATAVEVAHELLGRSPATLLSATLEDAVAEPRRPNMPGVAVRPNWCLPLPVRVEDLPAHPTATAVARTLNAAVQRPHPGPTQGGPESNRGAPGPAQGGPESNRGAPGPAQGGPESNHSTEGRPESGGFQGEGRE